MSNMWGQLLSLFRSKQHFFDVLAGIILGALMGFILIFLTIVGGDTV